MTINRTHLLVPLCMILCLSLLTDTAAAQSRRIIRDPNRVRPKDLREAATLSRGRNNSDDKTSIDCQLLSSGASVNLYAQRWGPIFEQLGVSLRVRKPILSDEPEVKETTRGTLRRVTIVGNLTARGEIVFPEKKFSLQQTKALAEWIDELRTYGAQGAPDGQPAWGLEREQFAKVFDGLSKRVTTDVKGQPLDEALQQLPLPEDYPLKVRTSAESAVGKALAVRQSVAGLTVGTMLAVMLRDEGLGFRPLRAPGGEIELVVQPLSEISDPWPIGWEPDFGDAPPGRLTPELFKVIEVNFDGLQFPDVVGAISRESKTPVFVDWHGARKKGVNLKDVRVTYPQKRVSYSVILGSVARQALLNKEIRTDELGTPFVDMVQSRPAAVER